MRIRIYYHDTDCGGIVYYANYLKYLEEARTEFFESRGVSIKDLAKEGILFVVARQEIDYESPAFYGDVLTINTWVTDVSRVKIGFGYEVKDQEGRLISKAKTIFVCVDKSFKPKAISSDVKKKITEATDRA